MFNISNALPWTGTKRKDDKNGQFDLNVLTANDYYDRLKLIALSLFEWEGLPDSCNARFLESCLYMYGRALFIKDANMGYLNTQVNNGSMLNTYNEPTEYIALSAVYPPTPYPRDNCVLIRNNYLERPTDNSVLLFAGRLTEAQRTIDVNIKAQKTPVVICCDEKDRLSLENVMKQYADNVAVILGSKTLNIDSIKVLKTEAPYIADKVQAYMGNEWNNALTFFGINNANSDKRERLITDEVNANNEVISINAQAMLLTRLEACEAINKMFGEKVSVKMRNFEGVNDNGEVHSGIERDSK